MTEEHILVVKDEKKIADLLKDYLDKESFKVSWVCRGDEVVEKIKKHGAGSLAA
jgi:DNA-binding response OmpR family regulator